MILDSFQEPLLYLLTGYLESTTVSIAGSGCDPTKTNRAYRSIGGRIVIVKLFNPAARAFPIPTAHGATGGTFVVEQRPGD